MKKVLHISHSLETGGGPEYIKKIISHNDNYDYYVIGNKGFYYDYFKELLGKEKVFELKKKNILYNNYLIKKIIRKVCPDIIHIHGRGASIYARMFNKKNAKKTIYTLHGFNIDNLGWIKKFFYLNIEKLFSDYVKKIVCVSNSEKYFFLKNVKNIDKNKIVTIPNYIDHLFDHDYMEMENIRKYIIDNFGIDIYNYDVRLITISRFTYQKGIDLSVEALKNLKKYNFLLIIIGEGREEPKIREKIQEYNLNDNILLLGKINNARTWLKSFDGLLLSSRFEGMPFTLLEAVDACIPVIVTPSRGIIDVVGYNYKYLSRGIDENSLKDVLEKYFLDFKNNKQEISYWVETLYNKLKNEYSKENTLLKIYELYESI